MQLLFEFELVAGGGATVEYFNAPGFQFMSAITPYGLKLKDAEFGRRIREGEWSINFLIEIIHSGLDNKTVANLAYNMLIWRPRKDSKLKRLCQYASALSPRNKCCELGCAGKIPA